MKLHELPWKRRTEDLNRPNYWLCAHLPRPGGGTVYIETPTSEHDRDRQGLYCIITYDGAGSREVWNWIDPITAQAVLYHLLSSDTQEGNDEAR